MPEMTKKNHTGGVFLTVKNLMILTGCTCYSSAARTHKAIRDSIATGKKKLTVMEYCQHEGLDYGEITKYLHGYL